MKKLDEILNSNFFKNEILDIDKENEELKKNGWSREDINQVVGFIVKNTKH